MRSICVYTSTRADYGILRNLLKKIDGSSGLNLQLLASGTHLVAEQGMTIDEIHTDGFSPVKCVDIDLSDDSPTGVCHSMGVAISLYGKFFAEYKPDLLVLLGDRFETFCCAAAAQVSRIPIAHIHGGELTQGAVDEAFRHSITKMAHFHFPCCEIYRNRIIQMGEIPGNVYNVGALGAENIRRIKLMEKEALEKSIAFKLDKPFFLLTFHPVTLEGNTSEKQLKELFLALESYPDHKFIFTGSNADAGGQKINRMLNEFKEGHPGQCIVEASLGFLRYLSAMKLCDAVVGNSSSGILEAPVFRKPTVNIGDRQKGRACTESVIHCDPEKDSIIDALKKAVTAGFQLKIKQMEIIFEKPGTAEAIKKILKEVNLDNILKKQFTDINLKLGSEESQCTE